MHIAALLGSRLCDPVEIGTVTIKNRIAMAPMGPIGLCNQDGTISQRLIDYYVERAKGGVGLIITGATKVENDVEQFRLTRQPIISLNPRRFLQTSAKLTESIHTYGTRIFIQLTAGFGRVAHPSTLANVPIAPSATHNYWDPDIGCKELSQGEIERLVKAFEDAAALSMAAGFDGIEIHAMHEGYLVDQFAIALWNKREDKYGGDLKERLTFPVDILRAIKSKVGKEFPVQLRFSIKSYVKDSNRGAVPYEVFEETARDVDESLEAARILEREGYDAFNADAGSYEASYWAHPPTYMKHGCYLELAGKLKKVVRVPVIVAGKMDVPQLAEKAVEEGKADVIALGRALLADPYWFSKIQKGRIEDIRPCIGCHDGCLGRTSEGKTLCCAVNAAAGQERLYELKPAVKAKEVLIAGGGVAGMEAARVAFLRGHKVALYEKSGFLGGHLIEASVPDFKKDIERLLNWYKYQFKRFGLNIFLNTEVSPKLVITEEADAVILATGSDLVQPEIEGIEKGIVAKCIDLLREKRSVGDRVAVLGGGLVGCETALWLAQHGKEVTIIEILSDLMTGGLPVPHANRRMLLDLLAIGKVKMITDTRVDRITDEGVVLIKKDLGTKEMKCDTVALALGLKPKDRLYNLLRGKVEQLYKVGDCRKTGRILEAIWDGYSIASTI
jgi:2-enoate reductase